MDKIHTIWNFIRRHKYLVVTLIFLIIVGVLDENSWLRRLSHQREIAELKAEIEKYTHQYEEDSRMLEELNNNPEAIEKIAREKYLMKRSNEDIYIIKE